MKVRAFIIIIVVCACLALPAAAQAAPGDLDPFFGGGSGYAVGGTPWTFDNSYAHGVAIQSTGRIVAGGGVDDNTAASQRFALAGYAPTGALDATFNGGGTTVPLTGGAVGTSVARQPDDKIVVAGSQNGFGFAVMRFVGTGTDAGKLDTTFDTDGIATTTFGSAFTAQPQAFGVTVQPDGNIVVVGFGTRNDASTGNQNRDEFVVARYLGSGPSAGQLDTSFNGGQGWVATPIGGGSANAGASAVTIEPDQGEDKILVVGSADDNTRFGLARYHPNGTLDTSFDVDGLVTTPVGTPQVFGNAVALQGDKIVVAGSTDNSHSMALGRYNSDGSLDHSFDVDGLVTTQFSGYSSAVANGVAIQANGKIVVAGSVQPTGQIGTQHIALARYSATSGALDPAFGTGGRAVAPQIGEFALGDGLALDDQQRIVVAGQAGNPTTGGSEFLVARFQGGDAPPPEARGAFVRTEFESTEAHFKGQFNTGGEGATCGFDIVPERFVGEGLTGPHSRRIAQGACSTPSGDTSTHDYGELEGEGTAAHGLTPGEKYRYRFFVSNSRGSSQATGPNFTFTTADIEAREAFWRTTGDTSVQVTGRFRTFGGQGTCTVVLEPRSFSGGNVTQSQPCSSSLANVGEAVCQFRGLRPDSTYHYRFQVTVNGVTREVTGSNFIITIPPSQKQFEDKRVPTAEIKKDLSQETSHQIHAYKVLSFPSDGEFVKHLVLDNIDLAKTRANGDIVAVGAGSFGVGPNQYAGQVFVAKGNLVTLQLTNFGFGVTVPVPKVVAVGAGSVVAVGAGNVVAVGAGNVVAVGAGNVVGVGAGNVVAVGAGSLGIFERTGRVVAVGAGSIVGVGAGSVVAVGAGNVVAVGAGSLTTVNGAQLLPYLDIGNLNASLASIVSNYTPITAGSLSEGVRIDQLQRGFVAGAGIARRRARHRLVTVWKARTRFTRFGTKKVVLKPTQAGLRLLRRIARVNVRRRKHHRAPLKLRVSIRATFKPKHGKRVTVRRRATTRSRRR